MAAFRKRFLALLLALLLCLSLFPAAAFAEDTVPGEEMSDDTMISDGIERLPSDTDILEEDPESDAGYTNGIPFEEEEAPVEEDAWPEAEIVEEEGEERPDDGARITGFADMAFDRLTEVRKPALCEVLKQLPKEMTVYIGGIPAQADAEDPTVPLKGAEQRTVPVVWECVQDYDEWLTDYDFFPVFEGLEPAEGLEVPVIRLTVEDLSIPACDEMKSGVQSDVPIVGAVGDMRYAAPSYNGYELGNLPPIRNQNPYGTCWAHAAIGAMEADLIAGGQASPDSIDLSELHLIYFSKNTYTDPKGLNVGDWINPDYGRNFMSGGNSLEASLTMANMVGPVDESYAPYSLAESYAPAGTDAKSMNAAQLVGAYKMNPGDRDAIKEAILTHGAVVAAMAAIDSYYSASNNSYCYPGRGTNHDVLLVGWDDNFSRDKFMSKPEGNGAWLVRNSWGGKGYSYYSYFWLSYYDQSVLSSDACWAYDADRQTYDNVYAYDSLPGLYWSTNVDAGDSVIQHFTVDSQERVEAVGMQLGTGDSIRISVTDGTNTASASYSSAHEGFYLIRLNTPFTVAGKKDLTVTVTYDSSGTVFFESGSSQDQYGNRTMEAYCGSGGFVIHHVAYDWDRKMSDDVRIKLFTNNNHAAPDAVSEFVRRGYSLMLGREADESGLQYYVNLLISGQLTGAQMVSNFMNSPEFTGKMVPNEEAVAILYRVMMNREPDADGLRYHSANLDSGLSYNCIINGFSDSAEFRGICGKYGIAAGTVDLEWRDRNLQVTAFVRRNYELTLERKAAGSELNYYCEILLNHALTPQQVAHNFVFSPECVGRGLSDRTFIQMLYHLFMDRNADEGGLNYYQNALAAGTSREQIEANFGASPEFARIIRSYGLVEWEPDIVFTTTDLYGTPYNDSIFADAELTMLYLWGYPYPPCVNELQDLQRLQNDYAARGLQLFGVSYDVYTEGNKKEFEKQGITYPSLIGTESLLDAVATVYIPSTIFVDKKGHILNSEPYIGSRDYDLWAEIVEEYLG